MEIIHEPINGIVDDIVVGFQKIMRPKNAAGEVQPMGKMEVSLTDDTKMFIGGLAVGSIVLIFVGQALINKIKN